MRFSEGKENLCRMRIYQISSENQMFPIFVTNVRSPIAMAIRIPLGNSP